METTTDLPEDLRELLGKRIVIVDDDVKGRERFVNRKGMIVGWRRWKYNRFIPLILFDSGEIVSDSKIWWVEESKGAEVS